MGLTKRIQERLRVVGRVAVHGALAQTPSRRDDMDATFWALQRQVAPYTMTSPERLFALRDAIRYICSADIPGDVVECGVWRGGSAMMAALAMVEEAQRRRIWLYDTFEGMTEPGEHDRDFQGVDVRSEWEQRVAHGEGWAKASLEDVLANMATTRYPADLLEFVQGPVEDTIPERAPEAISLLRLDTDWHESTRHELEHLWPRLSTGGVLIIDDYGHFQGARKAVDEFFASRETVLLTRVDYTGRMTVKP